MKSLSKVTLVLLALGMVLSQNTIDWTVPNTSLYLSSKCND
jgi:hypothetical protein